MSDRPEGSAPFRNRDVSVATSPESERQRTFNAILEQSKLLLASADARRTLEFPEVEGANRTGLLRVVGARSSDQKVTFLASLAIPTDTEPDSPKYLDIRYIDEDTKEVGLLRFNNEEDRPAELRICNYPDQGISSEFSQAFERWEAGSAIDEGVDKPSRNLSDQDLAFLRRILERSEVDDTLTQSTVTYLRHIYGARCLEEPDVEPVPLPLPETGEAEFTLPPLPPFPFPELDRDITQDEDSGLNSDFLDEDPLKDPVKEAIDKVLPEYKKALPKPLDEEASDVSDPERTGKTVPAGPNTKNTFDVLSPEEIAEDPSILVEDLDPPVERPRKTFRSRMGNLGRILGLGGLAAAVSLAPANPNSSGLTSAVANRPPITASVPPPTATATRTETPTPMPSSETIQSGSMSVPPDKENIAEDISTQLEQDGQSDPLLAADPLIYDKGEQVALNYDAVEKSAQRGVSEALNTLAEEGKQVDNQTAAAMLEKGDLSSRAVAEDLANKVFEDGVTPEKADQYRELQRSEDIQGYQAQVARDAALDITRVDETIPPAVSTPVTLGDIINTED